MNSGFLKFDHTRDTFGINANSILYKYKNNYILKTTNSKYSLTLEDALLVSTEFNLTLIEIHENTSKINTLLKKYKNQYFRNNELYVFVDSKNDYWFWNFKEHNATYICCNLDNLKELEILYEYVIHKNDYSCTKMR